MNYKSICAVVLGCCLSACQGVNPVLDTVGVLFPTSEPSAHHQVGFEYLRVSYAAHRVDLALGWRTTDGPVVHEYWYSGQREMLHLLNGRLFNVIGVTQELRAQLPVNPAAPSWQAIAMASQSKANGGALVWSRTRDLQPGYRYGVVEYIASRQIKPSDEQKAWASSAAAVWFEDQVESKTRDGQVWRYMEWFAVVDDRVVHSLQCVGPDLCLRLQPLGVTNR